jgi:hypothetical protein
MGNVHPFSPADWVTANLKTSRADHRDQEGSTSQQREELVQQIGLRYIKGVVVWSKKYIIYTENVHVFFIYHGTRKVPNMIQARCKHVI